MFKYRRAQKEDLLKYRVLENNQSSVDKTLENTKIKWKKGFRNIITINLRRKYIISSWNRTRAIKKD